MSHSFEQLVHQNMGRIRRIAQRYAPGENEDLLQEILVALWRGYDNFRGDSKAETLGLQNCLQYRNDPSEEEY